MLIKFTLDFHSYWSIRTKQTTQFISTPKLFQHTTTSDELYHNLSLSFPKCFGYWIEQYLCWICPKPPLLTSNIRGPQLDFIHPPFFLLLYTLCSLWDHIEYTVSCSLRVYPLLLWYFLCSFCTLLAKCCWYADIVRFIYALCVFPLLHAKWTCSII